MPDRINISTPSLGEAEWQALREPLESGWLTQGPKVAEFEQAFGSRHEAAHAIATTSCTTALHLMLVSAGIGPGDEVIVPSFTWVATANAVVYTGATPVLADVDPSTYNLCLKDVVRRVTPRTRAVIAVHLFGACVDIPALQEALPDGVAIFEDAACAAGASIGGKPAGSMGVAAAFSFHPRKTITTGEGGMLTTNGEELASTARKLRSHGAEISEEQRHYGDRPYLLPDFNLLGFNYRMTDLQAAVGIVQLAKLDGFLRARQAAADLYRRELQSIDQLQMPSAPENGRHAWQAFVVRLLGKGGPAKRSEVMAELEARGIATRPGTHAIHSLGYYSSTLSCTDGDLPGAALCRDTTLAIPLHNAMDEHDYARVVDAVKSAMS